MTTKRLTKSQTDKMIAGVCGGLAEYMNADPTLVRVIYAVLTLLTAVITGIVVYIVLALVMPDA